MSWAYQPFLSGVGQATFTLAADAGAFAVTPPVVRITYTRRLIATAGTFVVFAMPVTPKAARTLSAGAGSISISSEEAGFNRVPVVAMESGAFVCQFQPCAITMNRRLVAGHRLVRVIGQSVMQADAPLAHQSADISLSIGL
jgi:hypothetical protein